MPDRAVDFQEMTWRIRAIGLRKKYLSCCWLEVHCRGMQRLAQFFPQQPLVSITEASCVITHLWNFVDAALRIKTLRKTCQLASWLFGGDAKPALHHTQSSRTRFLPPSLLCPFPST